MNRPGESERDLVIVGHGFAEVVAATQTLEAEDQMFSTWAGSSFSSLVCVGAVVANSPAAKELANAPAKAKAVISFAFIVFS